MTRRRFWMWSALPLLLAFATAQAAFAQRSPLVDRDREVRRHSDLRSLADEAEKLSDSFKNHLGRELDHSIIDGTRKEKQYEQQASKLENALDDVRSSVRDGKNFNHTRDRVKRALKYADEMDRDLARLPHSRDLEGQWRELRSRLDQLAYFYEARPPVGGMGRHGRS
jgi:hypothetical protein